VRWLLLAGAFAVGCQNPPECPGRGAVTHLSGVGSYAIANGAGMTMQASVDLDDYDNGAMCWYEDEEFVVAIEGCQLWVRLQQGSEPPGRFFPGSYDAWASIEPNQGCDLPLVGGTGAVSVLGGEVAFSGGTTTTIVLSGTVTRWLTGTGATGPIEWQFVGTGAQ
jgi:hypothetical protein